MNLKDFIVLIQSPSIDINNRCLSRVVSPFDAHCRPGHPSLSTLRMICPQLHNLSSLNCDSYQFAEFHRLSTRWLYVQRASKLFLYFVTFVDDHSCMTWLYFKKNCFELLPHFYNFHVEILMQFGVCLKPRDVIMSRSIFHKHSICTFVHTIILCWYSNPKIGLQNKRMGIFLKLHGHYPFKCMFQSIFRLMQLPQLVFL